MGKLKVMVNHSGFLTPKLLLILLPVSISTGIALSRTRDYHHSFVDIVAGAMVGLGIGLLNYFMYFPSVFDSKCNTPRILKNIAEENDFMLRVGNLPFEVE